MKLEHSVVAEHYIMTMHFFIEVLIPLYDNFTAIFLKIIIGINQFLSDAILDVS